MAIFINQLLYMKQSRDGICNREIHVHQKNSIPE